MTPPGSIKKLVSSRFQKQNLEYQRIKWREDLINVITRGRLIDSDLKRKTNEDRLHIYEKHFKKEEIEHCKLILLFQLVYV